MTGTFSLTALEHYRQQFPALAHKAYFNYGGQGVMPQSAIAAIHQVHDYIQQIGPFSNEINRWIGEQTEQTRGLIASELQVASDTITLTEDVTVGCNIALWGVEWRSGDHLLLSDCEHPGIIAAALEIQRRFGVEVSFCPLMATLNEGNPVEVITRYLRPTTRLVVLSHVLWNTGQVLPLKEISTVCHHFATQAEPILVLIDAAQSVGMLPLDLSALGVDFYAFTGHKWLCGPAGVGGLYVRPEALNWIHPTFVGWRSITKNAIGYPTGWQPNGKRFEVATSDYSLYAALSAAIATHQQWGTATERYQRILQLSRYLWQHLSDLPHVRCLRSTPPESGLVSFQVINATAAMHNQFVNSLEKEGFLLRTILDPDCIRACVHYFTTESEIDRLVEKIQALQQN